MIYLLDTDTFSHIVIGNKSVIARLIEHDPLSVKTSAITHGEVLFGMHSNHIGARKSARIQELFEQIEILPLASEVGPIYGQIRAHLQALGKPIGPNDTWIAAHALSLHATLVTRNLGEFKRVPGLKVENWVAS
jgi:tRNA(fMet)-specific endonuclease VapC